LLIGNELDDAGENIFNQGCVAGAIATLQTQTRSEFAHPVLLQASFANATHAQQSNETTAIVHNPLLQRSQFFYPTIEDGNVNGFSPINACLNALLQFSIIVSLLQRQPKSSEECL
jgi:hypothetical protein